MSDIDPYQNGSTNKCLSKRAGSFFVNASAEEKKDILATTNTEQSFVSGVNQSKCETTILPKELDSTNNKLLCTPKSKSQSKRCSNCNKRLSLSTEYICKCAGVFCTKHRFPDSHGCTFDHKEQWKKSLEQKNPQVVAEKISKI